MTEERHKNELPKEGEGRARAKRLPPFSRDRFETTPEFENFKTGMKRLLSVPKSRLDELVRKSKETSPRSNNPNAAGRKKKAHGRNA